MSCIWREYVGRPVVDGSATYHQAEKLSAVAAKLFNVGELAGMYSCTLAPTASLQPPGQVRIVFVAFNIVE